MGWVLSGLLVLVPSACRKAPDGPLPGRADAAQRTDAGPRADAALGVDAASPFTLPLVSLVGGEAVAVHLRDRDGRQRLEEVGTVRARFAGKLPFTGVEGPNELSCSHLPQAQVEEIVRETLQSADQALSTLAGDVKVHPLGDDLGLVTIRFDCQRNTSNLAALVGWGDPRVQRRVEWCQRMERRQTEETAVYARAAEARAAAVTELRLQTRTTLLTLGRPRRDCTPGIVSKARKRFDISPFADLSRYPCLLRFPVRNSGPEFFPYSSAAIEVNPTLALPVISSEGRTERTGLLGMEGGVFTSRLKGLGPGAEGTLLFPVSEKSGRLTQLSTDVPDSQHSEYILVAD